MQRCNNRKVDVTVVFRGVADIVGKGQKGARTAMNHDNKGEALGTTS
jgi:hypothetical protein